MTDARPQRRPLPALICLFALTLLTALVWWRVLHRDSGSAQANTSCAKPKTSQTVLPAPPSVTVFVLNSTNRSGLAKSTATALSQVGFKVSGYGNDTGNPAINGVAEIRFSPDQKQGATLLGYYITHAKLVALPASSSQKLQVSLGNQFKAVTSAAGVASAMQAANTTVSPTPSAGATGTSTNC